MFALDNSPPDFQLTATYIIPNLPYKNQNHQKFHNLTKHLAILQINSMAISISSSFLIISPPNFSFNSKKWTSTSVRYGRSRISAAYATADRTSPATENIRSFRDGNVNPSSLYDVLGIRIGAEVKEVKAAYRRLARVLHPDVGNGDSSADEFMKVHSAYITLADPEKRADYDRILVQRRVGVSSPVRSGGGYRSRRWETDQCW